MKIEIEDDRIEVWAYDVQVIKISKGDYGWNIATSTCLPSDMERAVKFSECYAAAFKAYKEKLNDEKR